MKNNTALEIIKNVQNGKVDKLIQVDFAFANIKQSFGDKKEAEYEVCELGKYNTIVIKPFQFYKPYSRVFNIEKEVDDETE